MTSEGLLWPKLTTWSPLSPYAFQFIQPVCPPIAPIYLPIQPICLPIQSICLRIEPVCLRIQPMTWTMCLPIQLVWLLSGSLFLMNIIMIHDQHDHHDHHNHQDHHSHHDHPHHGYCDHHVNNRHHQVRTRCIICVN